MAEYEKILARNPAMENRLRVCESLCVRLDERMKTIESEHAIMSQVAKDLLMLKTNYEARKEGAGRAVQAVQVVCTIASALTAIVMLVLSFKMGH